MLRSARNYDKDSYSLANGTDNLMPSKTIQSAKDECDINVIVKRFGVTGQMPQSVRLPSYGDYDGISSFQTAMNVIRSAEESFMELPSEIRKRFGNDPQEFLNFTSDEANMPELRKMGLAKPEVPAIVSDVGDVPSSRSDLNERGVKARKGGRAADVSRSAEDFGGESEGSGGGD